MGETALCSVSFGVYLISRSKHAPDDVISRWFPWSLTERVVLDAVSFNSRFKQSTSCQKTRRCTDDLLLMGHYCCSSRLPCRSGSVLSPPSPHSPHPTPHFPIHFHEQPASCRPFASSAAASVFTIRVRQVVTQGRSFSTYKFYINFTL